MATKPASLVSDQAEALILYTIYEKPLDYPNEFVCRRWNIKGTKTVVMDEGEPYARSASAAGVRLQLPKGVCCIGRMKWDDPVILEVWL